MNNSMINDSLVERTPFIIPELSDVKFTSAELADDMDGLQLSFQRAAAVCCSLRCPAMTRRTRTTSRRWRA